MKLDPHGITQEGLRLVDEEGLDQLNMRALAKRFGVQASALYWHVGSKHELLSRMSATFYASGLTAAARGSDWREGLLAYGHSFRAALLSHRDSARLCAISRPVAESGEAARVLAEPLMSLGLTQTQALAYMGSVIALALGWTVFEQNSQMHDHLAQMYDIDQAFSDGLSAMVFGYEAVRSAPPVRS